MTTAEDRVPGGSSEGRWQLYIGLGWLLQGDSLQSPVMLLALWTCCEGPHSKGQGRDLDDDNDVVIALKSKDTSRSWGDGSLSKVLAA